MCVQYSSGDQKKALGSFLERELQIFVSRHMDVEIKPGSSARVASILNHWTFPPDLLTASCCWSLKFASAWVLLVCNGPTNPSATTNFALTTLKN